LKYLLDTNVCIHVLNGVPLLANRLREAPQSDIAPCSVVKFELIHGSLKSTRKTENLAGLEKLFSLYQCTPFDDRAAEVGARIRRSLEARGLSIGPYDTLIAATAPAHGLTLVTRNVGEFSRVEGLSLDDWESTPD